MKVRWYIPQGGGADTLDPMKKQRAGVPPEGTSAWFFIGRNIRQLRKKNRWTQTELGQKLARRKLSRQAIAWIESGRNTDLETITDIAATLGVEVETVVRRGAGDVTTSQLDHGTVKRRVENVADRPQLSLDNVSDLLSRPKKSWKSLIRGNYSLSGSTLGALLTKARDQFDDDPRRARDIGEFALHVLTLLDAAKEQVEPEMRAQAFRDAAWSSTRVGEKDQAMRYLTRADHAASACEDEQHQKAIVDLMRSIVLWSMEHYAEAREPLFRARTVLGECDRRRYLLTFHQEAMIEAKIGDPTKAAKIIEDIEDELVSIGNESDIAPIYTVGMYAWSRAGNAEQALKYGRKAAEINLRRGNVAEIAKDVLRHAIVLAQLGDFETAFSEFEAARLKLLELDLPQDVLYLDFYVLRAKAAAGADAHELHALCSRLAAAASAAQLPFTACEAIDWLRRISARLTTDEIDMVQSLVTGNRPVDLFL